MRGVRISYLVEHPEYIPQLAQWLFEQWDAILGEKTPEARIKKLNAHMNRDQLPIAWVAHANGQLLGTAALRVHDLEERKDLTPWLGGVFVEIGGGRKIHLEWRGTGSPTVVLISGTRGAHDDWTDLIDPNNPAGAPKPGESAVFPQLSKFTRVCAYDRPGTTRNDNTVTDSTLVPQPTTAQQEVADLHAL